MDLGHRASTHINPLSKVASTLGRLATEPVHLVQDNRSDRRSALTWAFSLRTTVEQSALGRNGMVYVSTTTLNPEPARASISITPIGREAYACLATFKIWDLGNARFDAKRTREFYQGLLDSRIVQDVWFARAANLPDDLDDVRAAFVLRKMQSVQMRNSDRWALADDL